MDKIKLKKMMIFNSKTELEVGIKIFLVPFIIYELTKF